MKLVLISMSMAVLACSGHRVETVTILPEPMPVTEESVRFDSGDLELGGLLLIPRGDGPFPAAMFIQGSGDSDRTNLWARGIAEGLARRGIVVLLPDKRGTGESQGDWRTAGFEEYAQDAIAGVGFLRSLPVVDAGFAGLIGLSQGGQVAPLAASSSREVAFVIDVSGSATTPVEQIDHEMRNTFRRAGLRPEDIDTGMKLQRLAGQYIRFGEWEPYRDMLDALADTPLAPIAAEFPQTRDSWVWSWWRLIGDYDPLDYWRRVKVPALVVYGEEDENDNVPVRESVSRLEELNRQRRTEIVEVSVFEDSGHALYAPGTTQLREDFIDLLVRWVHRHHQNR